MTPDVNIVLLDLPTKEKEAVTENEDGSYTIIINSRLSQNSQLLAYNHAMKHIKSVDFQKSDVQAIECAAHGITIPDNAERIPQAQYLRRLKAIQTRRRRTQKQLRALEDELEFIGHADLDTAFARAEHQWLYGNDL